MDLAKRIAEQVGKVPPVLKPLLDAELAAGNTVRDVEIGRGEDAGKVALVLQRPFHWPEEASITILSDINSRMAPKTVMAVREIPNFNHQHSEDVLARSANAGCGANGDWDKWFNEGTT